MLFGFGFNKAKVLASAERNVKQGRLHNAIADYERILKEDPKDLAVMNTVGDLCARLGQSEKAAEYFRKIGDTYASDGFTVRAIAMYKKLTKQVPGSLDAVLKLADLYTQQGLYSDARTQYMHVAENHLRNTQFEAAAQILQKTLALDPENTNLQGKLADVFEKLGRQREACDLYFRNAEVLRNRGSLHQADDALAHVMVQDPGFEEAMQLRGIVKAELGEYNSAIQILEKMPDIDSRPDAMRALLKAHLALGTLPEAEPIARKLLKVFDDASGVVSYADVLIVNGSYEQALELYREYGERLLIADTGKMMQTLQSVIARVKTSTRALEILAELFQLAGNATYVVEVTELLAHACAENGELARARDLYLKLTELEPENADHAQHHRQIAARVAENNSAEEPKSKVADQPESASLHEAQAGPAIETSYGTELSEVVDAALTEAELFDSYNLPAKAIPPLEAILLRAPEDVRLNLRLVSLYARCGRLRDASERCTVLARAYRDAGHEEDASRFSQLAAQYIEREGSAQAQQPKPVAAAPAEEVATATDPIAPDISAAATTAVAGDIAPPPPIPAQAEAHEIDLSGEWEQIVDLEQEQSADAHASSSDTDHAFPADALTSSRNELPPPEQQLELTAEPADEVAEEIRFYIAQSMWDEACAAIRRCEEITPRRPELAGWKAEVEAGQGALELVLPEVELVADNTAEADATPAQKQNEVTEIEAAAASVPSSAIQVEAVSTQPDLDGNEPDLFEGLVNDLEASLGNLDLPVAPSRTSEEPPVSLEPWATEVSAPAAPNSPNLAPPVDLVAAAAPVIPLEAVSAAPVTAVPGGMDDGVPGALADIFAEFKESMESSESQDDPETSYSLGVAFKEMGLLDEAIGELQKVCQAMSRGVPFSRAMQAYTWLADCFLQKGIPEAAVRWYQEALKAPGIDNDMATSVQYELACAYEAAGNKPSALSHFMQVYGTNIDYRDVAERIKALRS